MKSAAPDTPPSFRPEAKAVAQTVAGAPAYAEHWVRLQTAYFSTMLLLLRRTVVAVAAEVVTVVVVAAAADAVVAETPYGAVLVAVGDSRALPVTGAY